MLEFADPPKLSLTNLQNGAEVVAQFLPEEFEESVAPEWARLKPQGLSHNVHHFENTSPYVCGFKLYFRAFSTAELVLLQRARRHLLSWAYPRRISTSELVGGGPPTLLLVWPGMLSIEVVLSALSIHHERFNSASQSVQFTADVSFEERRGVGTLGGAAGALLTSEFVADDPEQRFGDPFFSE